MTTKSFRVRTQVGQDQNLTFELKQDFDLLEVLSLSLRQHDVYTRMCSDFGVIVGRVIVNNGFGVPNCKVSVFVPLEDDENDVIKELYPFKQPFDKGSDGTRYNLLSREATFACHTPVGNFSTLDDVLTNQDVEYVYRKYYKFTVKTNDAGDFMIYGVPTGEQQLVMDVDMSDIGCFSMLPEDFKIKGYPDSDFDGPHFRDDVEIDSLPQIVHQVKTVNVAPFWGDPENCNVSITRVDFDLGDSGMKIEPSAVFMGSTATDTGKGFVNRNCKPRSKMGELCSLASKPGLIDCIRYTTHSKVDEHAYPSWDGATGLYNGNPDGGEVPVLERFYLENGGRVIDKNGAFLVHIPMNLDFVTTNEFGELVKSYDQDVGIATRSRCRFRIRPEQTSGDARKTRVGSYLVPNISEFHDDTIGTGSYTTISQWSYVFSTEYSKYHPFAQRHLIPGAKDYFYDMTYNRVYSPSQFHDHVKKRGKRQFIGIKELYPTPEEQCPSTANYFPINSAVRRSGRLGVIIARFIIGLLHMIYCGFIFIVGTIVGIVGSLTAINVKFWKFLCNLRSKINGFTIHGWHPFYINCWDTCTKFCDKSACTHPITDSNCHNRYDCNSNKRDNTSCTYEGWDQPSFILFTIRQTRYPDCEKCKCRPIVGTDLVSGMTETNGGSGQPNQYTYDCDDTELLCCPDAYGFDSKNDTVTASDGLAAGGCYIKKVCMSMACNAENLSITLVDQWKRREAIAESLCKGVMGYYWENNWVTGFLYQHQFKAKTKKTTGTSWPKYPYASSPLDTNQRTYTQSSKFCRKTMYIHPRSHTFFYRSTPAMIDPSDNSKVIHIGYNFGMLNSGNHAWGDMDSHILFPTTIVDMGSRNECMAQICLDQRLDTGCAVTDQIGSTSYQDITDLVADSFDLTAGKPLQTVGDYFTRPEKTIRGDIAQALMQNCMTGVQGYETNASGTDCSCGGITTTQTSGATFSDDMEYPEVNVYGGSAGGSYVLNAINVKKSNYFVEWTPLMNTAATETLMSGPDVVSCLTTDLSGSSQVIPFYNWSKEWGAPDGFGGDGNDWKSRYGPYKDSSFSWTHNVSGPNHPSVGDLQNNMAEGQFGNTVNENGLPLIIKNSDKHMNFSRPMFYYFGLRPGKTSFDIFVTKYIDEDSSDTVV
jgi:hypothetical protein